ncbi:MAG: M1 family metallopeptidase [Solirubrobacteraceae bacterium]|nr:M1 family metallopeptidase [Solirubrobacteraceae bacterium]
MRPSILRAALGATVLAVALPSSAAAFTPGAAGLGDPFFPEQGNGGYDAQRYDVAIDYRAESQTLRGTVIMTARATQDLSSFNLDLRDFSVGRVLVNGVPAGKVKAGQELTITPRSGLRSGRSFVVWIDYGGKVAPVIDPDGSSEGWIPTTDGAYVVGEPQGTPGWMPVNDTPRDKALYAFAITVPKGKTVIANGRLVGKVTLGSKTTWLWKEDRPMASYLATATNGNFRFWKDIGPGGLPIYNAVDTAFSPEQQAAADAVLAKQGDMIAFFASQFGPYPYTSGGAIVDDAAFVGYALESQTKANYSAVPSEGTVAHEIAHQWFGNSVTLDQWPDIWLNEGFATWAQWRWDEHVGGRPTAQERFDALYARPETSSIWNPPVAGLTTPVDLFASSTYQKGAMTLQALRAKIGEADFTALLRAWFAEGSAETVTTADFIALAERISGEELSPFFDVWLFTGGKPVSW